MIMIAGAKGTIADVDAVLISIQHFAEEHQITIQVFDARSVYGAIHLLSAVEHAQRAFRQKTNAMKSLPLEIMLYASGERQIHKALSKMGIKQNTTETALLLVTEEISDQPSINKLLEKLLLELSFVRDDKVLEGDIDTLQRFGITQTEIETIEEDHYGDLILEKVALVDIIK